MESLGGPMKTLMLIPVLFLLQAYRPFTQDGSVDPDNEALEERIEKAQRNERQEKTGGKSHQAGTTKQ